MSKNEIRDFLMQRTLTGKLATVKQRMSLNSYVYLLLLNLKYH
jgi:hypothetical protein